MSPTKQPIQKKSTPPKGTEVKSKSALIPMMDVDQYGTEGKIAGKIAVPKIMFGQEMNQQVLSQAVRVYQANEREYSASVKTRGEVQGSTRKIYKQKGTGRARHGAVRAPIFVHGGIAHGPKLKSTKLKLPKKMKTLALCCALTSRLQEKVTRFTVDLSKKDWRTNDFASYFKTIDCTANVLLLVGNGSKKVMQYTRNIHFLHTMRAKDVNAYEIMKHKKIVMFPDSIEELTGIVTHADKKKE